MSVMEHTPPQYREAIQRFLDAYWNRRVWEIQETVIGVQIPLVAPETLHNSAFADLLAEIARTAAGQIPVEQALNMGVMEGIQDVCERLFAAPGISYSYHIPPGFWQSDLGAIIAKAQFVLRGEELISISEAAEIAGVPLSTMSSRVDRGQLRSWRDPDEPNPQRARRVLRSEVEEMIEQE